MRVGWGGVSLSWHFSQLERLLPDIFVPADAHPVRDAAVSQCAFGCVFCFFCASQIERHLLEARLICSP